MSLATLKNRRERGFFDGQFLIAMPAMEDRNFARTVIYICAHSDAGAMGFVINRPQNLTFTDVLLHLEMIKDEEAIVLPAHARDCPIQTGGPVESGRGFVLHSDDYLCDPSIPVSDDICMTATLDIIRAISGAARDRSGPPCCSATPAGAPASWRPKSETMAGSHARRTRN